MGHELMTQLWRLQYYYYYYYYYYYTLHLHLSIDALRLLDIALSLFLDKWFKFP